MILVGYSHGLRPSEVVAITADAIRDLYIAVHRLKGSMATVQPLIADANPLLDERTGLLEYARKFDGNQKLFPVTRRQFGRIFERCCTVSGIPRHLAHPHILKHTIAMQTIHSAGIENVRQYLGHKSISSTGAYLKVSDAEAAAAIAKGLAV
ncbi:MAG: tyrosine recombinase [Candidatus Sulfotelmatobacter sp.]|nr:tyrosine recombinase [Candidatus Sulfotelmatobacter sp.]